jgi:hypothetical protein
MNSTNSRDTAPQDDAAMAAAVLADVMTSTWQRLYTLNAQLLESLFRQSSQLTRQWRDLDGTQSTERPSLPDFMPWASLWGASTLERASPNGPATFAPGVEALGQWLRHSASSLEIWQGAGIWMARLAEAQLPGRSGDLQRLSRTAREEAIDATEAAIQASGAAISRGLGALARMTDLTARAAAFSMSPASMPLQERFSSTGYGRPADEEEEPVSELPRRRARAPGAVRDRAH